jgi:DNA-binding CsgD family transcriptional regulator
MMAGTRESARDKVVAAFFEAAVLPEQWPDALSSFAAAFRSEGALVLIWDELKASPALLEITGPLSSGKRLYAEYYSRIDPHPNLLVGQPPRHWVCSSQFFNERYMLRSEYFVDFLFAHGIRHGAAAHLHSRSHRQLPFIGLNRSSQVGPFSKNDLAELERLSPQLDRAVLLHQKLKRIQWENQAQASLLQQASFGVFLADADGRVVKMNQTAERIIATADGLAIENGVLTPARSFERAKLSKALEEPTHGGGAFLVGRPSGRLPYALLITPLPTELRLVLDAERPFAMILVTDFDFRTKIRGRRLSELFGFTNAEASLAVALAQGKDLRQIASATGQSLPTLRSHLRAMFEKAGVKRQADIVRLVLSIPAVESPIG